MALTADNSTPPSSGTTPSPSTTVPVTLPPKPQEKSASSDFSTYYQERYDDAFAYLKQMNKKERLDFLEMLRKKGFNSSVPVSPTGTDPSDTARVRELLVYQDTLQDVTVDQLLPSTIQEVKGWADKASSSGSRARTPGADLDSYLTSVMQQQLGRSPRADEMEKFRKAYAAMEAGGNEPTVTAAAQQQIETQNPGEYEASQFANFASTFETMLRGA